MNKVFQILLTLSFTGVFLNANSQEAQNTGVNLSFEDTTVLLGHGKEYSDFILERKIPEKLDFDLNVGSNVMFGSGRGSIFNNYIAPKATYSPGSRFQFSVGTFLMLSNMPADFFQIQENNQGTFRNSFASSYIYGSGEYLVNDRLRLRGSVMYELNPFNQYNNGVKNNLLNNDYFYSLGMDYKVSDSFNIGIEISQIKTDNPFFFYNSNPFGNRSAFRRPYDF